MTNAPNKICKTYPYNGKDAIYVGNGNSLPISHVGSTKIKTNNGDLNLNKILVVPGSRKNLLLVKINNYVFEFSYDSFVTKDCNLPFGLSNKSANFPSKKLYCDLRGLAPIISN